MLVGKFWSEASSQIEMATAQIVRYMYQKLYLESNKIGLDGLHGIIIFDLPELSKINITNGIYAWEVVYLTSTNIPQTALVAHQSPNRNLCASLIQHRFATN